MKSSNGATSSRTGSYMQLTRMSGQWGKLSWRRRCAGCGRIEVRERVLALDRVVGETPATTGADHERAVLLRANHHEADAGVAVRAWSRRGCAASISSALRRRSLRVR